MRSEQEMRDWIKEKTQDYEKAKQRYERLSGETEYPLSVHLGQRRSLYLKSINISTYNLVLGETQSAREWFQRAAEWARTYAAVGYTNRHDEDIDRMRMSSIPKHYACAIRSAILSDSDACIEETATEILDVDPSFRDTLEELKFTPYYYDKSRLLSGLSTNRDDVARAQIDLARETASSTRRKYEGFFVGACEGMLADDSDAVAAAIESMVYSHRHQFDGEPRGYREIMDHTAAATLVLAQRRGHDIHVDSEFIPDALVD